jgi:SNF2 family DNA or RNA helicase
MIASPKGVLIGEFQNPFPILKAIPSARYIRYKGKELVLVPHKLDEVRVLRNLGISAPSPIQNGYGWPGRWSPMSHQKVTADFFTTNPRCFCFNEMRTGKTASALWASDYLLSKGYIDQVLIISPLTVTDVWATEAFRTLPHRPLMQLVGARPKRLKLLKTTAQYKVINFDGLVSITDEVVKYFEGKKVLIIVDEAATYRTYGTDRYDALRKLIGPTTWLWMLTGTPTPNAPTDAWALAKLVNPKSVPKSFKVFQEALMRQVGPYKWVPKPNAWDLAYQALQPAIRFLRKDCLDIPPTMTMERPAVLTKEQQTAYDNLKRRMKYEDQNGTVITAANAAVRLLKLQQVFCGSVKDDSGQDVILDNETRFEVTHEIIQENNNKALVFVPFKASMHQLYEYLTKQGLRCAVVNGDTPKAKRKEYFDAFQHHGQLDVLIAHPATTAHGLDLSASSTIIWFAPTFSMEMYEQANARIQGPNQKEKCGVYHIAAHPLEWAIYEVVYKKSLSSDTLLAMYREEFAA